MKRALVHHPAKVGKAHRRRCGRPATALTLLVALFALAPLGNCQSSDQARYTSQFENDVVAAYDLRLPSKASTTVFAASHDTFWIALNAGELTFTGDKSSSDVVRFQAGDVRYFPSFAIRSIANSGSAEMRVVLVALKTRGAVNNPCECSGNTGKFVCGCRGASHLEPLWAIGLGDVTLAGTRLAAGEAFRAAAPRDDMLLVAVTDLELRDRAAGDAAIQLKSGEAAWIASGRHQFRNVGEGPAQFVTVEF